MKGQTEKRPVRLFSLTPYYVKDASTTADGASFENATMVDARLFLYSGRRACFAGADLTRSHLHCSDLDRADFMQAKLCDAWIVGLRVRHGMFPEADLSRVHAYGQVDFTYAQFDRANLTDADLSEHLLNRIFVLSAIKARMRGFETFPMVDEYFLEGFFVGSFLFFRRRHYGSMIDQYIVPISIRN